MCYKYKTFGAIFYIIYMSDFKIIDENKLEINVQLSYFEKTDYIDTYKKIIYNIEEEISIIGDKVLINNATKLRQKIVKILGTESYTYKQSYLRIGIRKGMFSQYRLDYDRELTDVSLNFPDDTARKQWLRVRKINKVLDI